MLPPFRYGAGTFVPSGPRARGLFDHVSLVDMYHEYRHAMALVELAALTAYHAEAFVRSAKCMSQSGVESYWTKSRSRLEAWSWALKQLESAADGHRKHVGSRGAPDLWSHLLPLAEEILTSELLTRVWAAIGCQLDFATQASATTPFVRSILVSHLETRHRLLRLVFHTLKLPIDQQRRIDQIRRRCERWNDVLLGYLVHTAEVAEFAFDADRVQDFSTSLCSQAATAEATKSLLMISLRTTFGSGFADNCPNPELNQQVCEAVLSCYGSDVFDAVGKFQSVWQIRLTQATNDTQSMIACLASEDPPSVTGPQNLL